MKANENKVVLDNKGNVDHAHYRKLVEALYAGKKASQRAENKPEVTHATNVQRRGSK